MSDFKDKVREDQADISRWMDGNGQIVAIVSAAALGLYFMWNLISDIVSRLF